MCLTIKSWLMPKVKIAETDIYCYKYVHQFDTDLRTPYYGALVEMGKTYKSKLICYTGGYRKYFWSKRHYYVDHGLHTFAKLESANNKASYGDVVVECIIPKGAKYYVGIFTSTSYASDKLTYIRIIK